MNELKSYTGYEYKKVTMDTSLESLWRDSMANFGWEMEKSEAKIVKRLPFALWVMAAPLSLLPWRPFHKQLMRQIRRLRSPLSGIARWPAIRNSIN